MATPRDERRDFLPNDIDAYAQHVEGIDPARYYDSQARDVWLAAMGRWSLLAAVLHPDGDTKPSS